METPIEGLGFLHMRGSGAEGLSYFLGFILSPAGIFRSYIELRETHKSSLSFFRCSFWKPSGLLPQGEGVCIWRVQMKPNNMESLKILNPKMFEILRVATFLRN